MIITIIIAIWLLSAVYIWGINAGFYYNLGVEYSILGTAKDQWEKKHRQKAVGTTLFMSLFGPVGVIAATFAALIVGYGLKFKFNWKG